MQQIMMLMQQYKVTTNTETYSVFMLHVMIFQNTDVFMEMVLVHLMKNLLLIYVHNMVELRVKKKLLVL